MSTDATALPGLLEKVPNRVKRLTADGGYDRREVYEAEAQVEIQGAPEPLHDRDAARLSILLMWPVR